MVDGRLRRTVGEDGRGGRLGTRDGRGQRGTRTKSEFSLYNDLQLLYK